MSGLNIDEDLLLRFEEGLDPRYPEKSKIPASVLGYGEMSTVFAFGEVEKREIAYKRIPIFENRKEVAQYESMYGEYHDILADEIGIDVPAFGSAVVETRDGLLVMFAAQQILDGRSIGHKAIHVLPDDEIILMVKLVLREMKKVFDFNRNSEKLEIAVDAQISNWSIKDFDSTKPKITEETKFLYLDTTTPFIRKEGVEQMDPELMMRAAPSFLIWIIRRLFLEDVMTRYYDFHLNAVDLIANFYKEQRPELIPRLIEMANDFFSQEAVDLGIEPITEKIVKSYYREDAMIWRLWMWFRQMDRFIRTRITGKGYPFILPGKIQR